MVMGTFAEEQFSGACWDFCRKTFAEFQTISLHDGTFAEFRLFLLLSTFKIYILLNKACLALGHTQYNKSFMIFLINLTYTGTLILFNNTFYHSEVRQKSQ